MALAPIEVSPVNETFKVSAEQASELWAESLPMPHDDDPERQCRLRISSCGKWAIRKMQAKANSQQLPVNEHINVALRQFSELQNRGISVISRAITPSCGGSHLFTITPWLRRLEACSPAIYGYVQDELLKPYHQGGPPSSWAITDIDSWDQFSALPESAQPFLHDADPYIATRKSIAVFGLLRNIKL